MPQDFDNQKTRKQLVTSLSQYSNSLFFVTTGFIPFKKSPHWYVGLGANSHMKKNTIFFPVSGTYQSKLVESFFHKDATLLSNSSNL